MHKRVLVAAACVAVLGACASGGGGERESAPIRALLSADALLFAGFDGDGDLATSSAEMEAGAGREFGRADANSDGNLQPIEFQNWANIALGGGQMGPYRLDFDRNVDNLITRAEFDTEIRARFTAYDADENGALVRTEYVRLVGQARPPQPPRQGTPPGGNSGRF